MFLNLSCLFVLICFVSGIAISDELDKVRFTARLPNPTGREMVGITLGNASGSSLCWRAPLGSAGFGGSPGVGSDMGKYSICRYIKSLIRDGLSTTEKKLSLSLRHHRNTLDLDTVFA